MGYSVHFIVVIAIFRTIRGSTWQKLSIQHWLISKLTLRSQSVKKKFMDIGHLLKFPILQWSKQGLTKKKYPFHTFKVLNTVIDTVCDNQIIIPMTEKHTKYRLSVVQRLLLNLCIKLNVLFLRGKSRCNVRLIVTHINIMTTNSHLKRSKCYN